MANFGMNYAERFRPDLYLLDTGTAAFILRGANSALRSRLAEVPMSNIAMSAITAAELMSESMKEAGNDMGPIMQEFFNRVEILPWAAGAAQEYSVLKTSLQRKGKPLDEMKMMIASHAISLEATLVTVDEDYKLIGKDTLKREDWTKRG